MNQRAIRLSERRPTTICCESWPICSRAEVPGGFTEVSFRFAGSKSMPAATLSTHTRSSLAMSWRTWTQASSLSGSGPHIPGMRPAKHGVDALTG